MSHVKTEHGLKFLCDTAKRGARVEVVLHHTLRRAPVETEELLLEAGAEVVRYRHADDLPMHAKFMLVDRPGDGRVSGFSTYGSLNLNERSLLFNHEVFVQDHDEGVFSQLDQRWREITGECRAQSALSSTIDDPSEDD